MSEEEFEKLRAGCALMGARSLSDFARAAVMRSVAAGPDSNGTGEPGTEIRANQIDQKVHDLESRVGELMNLIQGLRLEGGIDGVRSVEGAAGGASES